MNHFPVMLNNLKDFLKNKQYNRIIDCTFGAGGHSKELIKHCNELIAFDWDPEVKPFLLSDSKFKFIQDSFASIENYYSKADLIFADLGLSTMQIESTRGFSYKTDSFLDMKMNQKGENLKNILKFMPAYKMEEIIKNFGEEKQAKLIANNIDRFRLKQEIQTTFDLRKAIGIDKFNVLSRVFQAFRIFLNNEMEQLKTLLNSMKNMSSVCVCITFHSLEDRLVKNMFKASFVHSGFIAPSSQEIEINPPSRSAKLRFAYN